MHADGGATEDPSGLPAASFELRTWITGLLVSLVIVVPTFFTEEFWHGAPLIDRGGASWLVPAIVMGLGFTIGGIIAGYRRVRLSHAVLAGLLVGGVTIVFVFGGDLIRRHALGQHMKLRVLEYWVGAVASALLVGGLGAVSGYWLAGRAWARRQLRPCNPGTSESASIRATTSPVSRRA